MTDLMGGGFLPRVRDLESSREPVEPNIGTTTTTVPRFRPGDTAPSTTTMAPTTTVGPPPPSPTTTMPNIPATTVPLAEEPLPTLGDVQSQTQAFADTIRNTDVATYADDPRYQYTMPPLGLRGAASPITVREVMNIGGREIIQERPEYILNPQQARNRALERFNREAEVITRSVYDSYAARSGAGGLYAGQQFGIVSQARSNYIDIDAGDKYTTAADVYDYLQNMSVNELGVFKNRLVNFGLIKPNQRGEMSIIDINDDVWKAALTLGERANENGIKYQPFVDMASASGLTFQPITTDSGPRIPPVRITSPDDIKYTANRVALQRIGRELTEPEQEAFISSYNQMERDFHRQYYGNASQLVETPSIESAALTMVEDDLAREAELYATGDVLDSFRQIIGGAV